MKTEGIFLVEIKQKRGGGDPVPKTITDIELPNTVQEIFEQSEEIAKKLGDRIQQVYITVGRVIAGAGSTRKALDQNWIMFDLDYVIQDKKEEYIKIFCEHFKLDRNKTGIVDSGYGLQFHVAFKIAAVEKDFDDNARYFEAQAKLLEVKLDDAGLIGEFETHKGTKYTHVDRSVYRVLSLARFPNTINHDPAKNRPQKPTKLLQAKVAPQAESLGTLLQIDLEDEPGKPELAADFRTDGEYVKTNCGFIKHFVAHPEEMHEPDFFTFAGIYKKCFEDEETGVEATFAWFKSIVHRLPESTLGRLSDKKIYTKIRASFASSYKKIDSKGDWCKGDPGRPRNKHPLQMRSPDFIETEKSGFRFPPPPGKQYRRMDHDGLIKYFRKKKGYFVSEISEPQKTLYKFDKTHYKTLYPAETLEFSLDHVFPAPSKDERNEFLSRLSLDNMQDLNQLFFEKTEGFVNTASGIVNIKTQERIDHSPDFGFSYVLPYKYDSGADCPMWKKTIGEYMLGCEENIKILQMFGGYVLAGGSCKAQALLILTGEGQNGKSVYWKLLGKLLGWVQGGAFAPMKEPDFERPHALANLRTKLMCIIEEPDPYLKSAFWEAMKDYSAGGVITGSLKFKNQIEFENRAKFIISMNQFSSGTAQTFGFLRRLKIVHFPHEIPMEKRIFEFEDVLLKSEGSGILNWFMEGYRELERLGFKFPTTAPMQASLEEYKINTNMVYAFSHELGIELGNPSDKGFATGDLDLHYLDGANSGLLRDEVYAKYSEFVKKQFPETDSHRYKIEAKNKFTQKLRQYFKFEEKKVGGRGSQRVVLVGIRVKNFE